MFGHYPVLSPISCFFKCLFFKIFFRKIFFFKLFVLTKSYPGTISHSRWFTLCLQMITSSKNPYQNFFLVEIFSITWLWKKNPKFFGRPMNFRFEAGAIGGGANGRKRDHFGTFFIATRKLWFCEKFEIFEICTLVMKAPNELSSRINFWDYDRS